MREAGREVERGRKLVGRDAALVIEGGKSIVLGEGLAGVVDLT